METYTFLRELADSWALLAMTLFFLGVVGWTFRPGARELYADTSAIPLRNDELPSEDDEPCGPKACSGTCSDCKNRIAFEVEPDR